MVAKRQIDDREWGGILDGYGVGEMVVAEEIAAGTVQTNYRIETSEGRFVWRCYENRDRAYVAFERDLLLYLAGAGFPCVPPVSRVDGGYIGEWWGRPTMLFPWVEGEYVAVLSAKQKGVMIDTIAWLHRLTAGYVVPNWKARWNYGPEFCLRLGRERAAAWGTAAGWAKVAWMEEVVAGLGLPELDFGGGEKVWRVAEGDVMWGVCHADLDPSNWLWQGDELVALLDFDDANQGYLLFDLVCLIELMAWPHWSEEMDVEIAKAVVERYSQGRELMVEERRYLLDVHQLSVLVDCLWFFRRGEGEDFYEKRKIEYLRKLEMALLIK
ncbi:MAG TPA: homoserine kinase [Anaerolineae bacterium]|nr:homoserine kinase [Anaerolineae bacterium]